MKQQNWIDYANDNGRQNLPRFFVDIVKDIVSDNMPPHTKIIGIARELRFMEVTKADESLPWDVKE